MRCKCVACFESESFEILASKVDLKVKTALIYANTATCHVMNCILIHFGT